MHDVINDKKWIHVNTSKMASKGQRIFIMLCDTYKFYMLIRCDARQTVLGLMSGMSSLCSDLFSVHTPTVQWLLLENERGPLLVNWMHHPGGFCSARMLQIGHRGSDIIATIICWHNFNYCMEKHWPCDTQKCMSASDLYLFAISTLLSLPPSCAFTSVPVHTLPSQK